LDLIIKEELSNKLLDPIDINYIIYSAILNNQHHIVTKELIEKLSNPNKFLDILYHATSNYDQKIVKMLLDFIDDNLIDYEIM